MSYLYNPSSQNEAFRKDFDEPNYADIALARYEPTALDEEFRTWRETVKEIKSEEAIVIDEGDLFDVEEE